LHSFADKTAVTKCGPVAYLIAPNTYHHMKVSEWQVNFPEAKTYVCPGLEIRVPTLKFDGILKDKEPEADWKAEIEQILFIGKAMQEMLFYHRPTKTLIAIDLCIHQTDASMTADGTNQGMLKFMLTVMRDKNKAVMSSLYRIRGFRNKPDTKARMEHVMNELQPERIIVTHGENIQGKNVAKQKLQQCWSKVLV